MNAITPKSRGLLGVRAEAAPDIRGLVNQIKSSFEEFKAANDQALAQRDVVTTEKVDRINAHISDLQAQLADLASRSASAGLGQPLGDVQAAAEFSRQIGHDVDAEGLRDYRAGLNTYLRRGGATPPEVLASMSVGSDPDGGYTVEPSLAGRIVQRVYETSPVRQVASTVTIGTDAIEGFNDLDEADSGWVGEEQARPETDTPTLGKWRIPVHELYAMPRATQKLLDDSSWNVESWLAGKISDRFSRQENAAFVNGDGNLKPRGFLTHATAATADTTRPWGTVQYVPTGQAGSFLDLDITAGEYPGDALINLVFALKAAYRSGAVFMMSRLTLAEVRKLKDADGRYLWEPNFQARQGGALLGYPIVEAEDMPAITSDSLSVAFGDFSAAYQIVDRLGIRILRDPYTSKGFVKFYATRRVGGDLVNSEALKLLKFSAT